ncbi:MAG: exodeoxyribonuclease VII small subunit [Lentisphaerae bacterium]|nr:exodeoxyribonuclease VII small subunit [Lentisphaerota bacterium]
MAKRESETHEGRLSFEAALTRLETLVGQMESGELGLDDLVAAFEEGQKLVKQCSDKLNAVERRIEILVKDETGAVTARPFEPDQT